MFASTILSRLTNSTSQPLLPLSSSPSSNPPYTDITIPSATDAAATLLAFARQEAHLQSHIQYLLDIQSDRLLEGLGEAPSPSRNKARRNGHPRTSSDEEPTSLQATRSEITSAIQDLASLKTHTTSLLSSALTSTTLSISAITSLQSRKTALIAKISELESSPSSASLNDLAKEEETLGREIYELETRLFEMKARRRGVRQRLEEGRNREDARASSWRRSLELLEGDEAGLVGRKPEGSVVTGFGGGYVGRGKGKGAEGVWDLPPKRRTLDMVREYHAAEQAELRDRLEGVEREREALEEGGKVWESVVATVGKIEGLLEKEMKRLGEDSGHGERRDGMERVLASMKEAREKVEGVLRGAEERGWRLLVVAVGAELEALVEGEGVLRGALGLGDDGTGEQEGRLESKNDMGQEPKEARDISGDMMGARNGTVEETDDDEPGPELLLSTQDEDIGQLRI